MIPLDRKINDLRGRRFGRLAEARAPPRLKVSQKGARGGGNSALQTKLRNSRVLVSQNLYLLGQFP